MVGEAGAGKRMSGAREEILAAIRRAMPDSPPTRRNEYETIPRDYPVSRLLGEHERLDLFERRLLDYNATVYRCGAEEIVDAIARALCPRGANALVIPRGFPRKLLPEGFVFTADDNLSYEDLDGSGGALTGCALAIAQTGTIVLRHSDVEGRRALTLIPDYHLCIVRASQVVETVVEGVRAIARLGPDPITTISGPSATADIEMTRVKGVHGPRTLDVILVAG